nr:hypothetical protein [Thalassionema frauenfeldii]
MQNNNTIKNPRGFPFEYYENEVVTSEMVKQRINVIYMILVTNFIIIFSSNSILDSFNYINKPQSIKVNKIQSKNKKVLSELRGGSDFIEIISRIIFLYTISQSISPTDGFKPVNPAHFNRDVYGYQSPTVSTKLKPNPVDFNNNEQKNLSMDELCKVISPEHTKFRNKYFDDISFKRFDTKEYSIKEFKQLATDPTKNTTNFKRREIDEARAIIQAKLENLIVEPTRPTFEKAKSVNLDFEIKGPAPYKYCDVKHPVGSHILKRQGQSIDIEQMSYDIGKNIVKQKSRFIGKDGGPESPKDVCHLVDMCYVPDNEKSIVRQNILKGALDSGSNDGIKFINHE